MQSGRFRREVTLEIPDDFPLGEATLTVSAEESADDTEFGRLFGDILDDILDQEEDDEKLLPKESGRTHPAEGRGSDGRGVNHNNA